MLHIGHKVEELLRGMVKDALFRMSGHLIRLYCGWHSRGWRATGGYSLRAFWLRTVFVCNFADDFTLDLAEDFDADIGFAEDFDFGLGFVLAMNLHPPLKTCCSSPTTDGFFPHHRG